MNKYNDIIKNLTNSCKIDLICQSSYDAKEIQETNLTTVKFVFDTFINRYLISLNDSYIKSSICEELTQNQDVHTLSLSDLTCEGMFFKKHFLSLYFNSLNTCGFHTCFKIDNSNNLDIQYELKDEIEVIKNSKPEYVIVSKYISLGLLNSLTGTENKLILNSEDLNEIVNAINTGYKYIITSEETKSKLLEILNGDVPDLTINIDALDKMLEDRFSFVNQNNSNLTRFENFKDCPNEMSILLKNDSILPLSDESEMVLVGACAINDTFSITAEALKYKLNTTTYVHGYSYDDVDNSYLIKDTLNKTLNKIVLLYVKTDENGLLGDKEVELIKELNANMRQIILVSLGVIKDLEIINLCNACISVGKIEDFAIPTFDVLYGLDACGAKTIDSVICDNNVLRIPYYGLQVSPITVKNINLNHDYIEFFVMNESNYCLEDTFFLTYKDNVIGFVKTKLKNKEGITISIPVNLNEFLTYDFETLNYKLEDNEFNLALTNFTNFSEEVKLTFASDEEKAVSLDTKLENKNHSKAKFIVLSSIYAYILVMLLIIVGSGNTEGNGSIFIMISILILTLIYVVCLIKFFKNKKNTNYKPVSVNTEIDLSKLPNIKKNNDIIYKVKVSDNSDVENNTLTTEDSSKNVVEVTNTTNSLNQENQNEALNIINPDITNENFDDFEESTTVLDMEKEIANFERIENAKDIDLTTIANDFSKYLLSKGLTTNLSTISLLFSSLVSEKFIVLKSNDLSLEQEFVKCLQEYLNNKVLSLDLTNVETFSKALEDPNFVEFINNSNHIFDNVSCLYVTNSNSHLNSALKPFVVQTKNNTNVNVTINNLKVALPKNAFFLISSNNFNEYSELTFEIDLELADVIESNSELKIISLTCSSLHNLVKTFEKSHYISEEEFKKIDSLLESLSNSSLSNKSTLDFESIYVLLSLEDIDMRDAVDYLLRGRLMPLIKESKLYKNNKNEVINTVSKIFDDSMYPRSLKYLNKDEEVINNE